MDGKITAGIYLPGKKRQFGESFSACITKFGCPLVRIAQNWFLSLFRPSRVARVCCSFLLLWGGPARSQPFLFAQGRRLGLAQFLAGSFWGSLRLFCPGHVARACCSS
jgi:hypothetical protein